MFCERTIDVTTARYDFALFRPENLVTVVTEGGTITPSYA